MSNNTTLLDTIATNQANKEVVVNALLDAASPAMLWGRHASACNGLTWGYYGGTYMVGSTANAIANGTVTLTASATNYLYASAATGAVSVNTTGVPAGAIPLYQIVAGATTVTSYTDMRSFQPSAVGGSGGGGTVTSVALALPSDWTVTGSPVTGSGTLTGAYAAQPANYIHAGPTSGGAAAPTWRALVGADLPLFGASGTNHAPGGVPDPGATAGTTRFLREDGTWVVPSGSSGSSTLAGLTDVNVTEGAAIDKFGLRFDNGTSKWIAEARPYDLVMFAPGIPAGGALMARVIVPRVATFPAGLTGSYASATAAATAAATLTLARNGTAIGTINFAAGATSGTFTFSSAVTTTAGDVLTITNQSTADATLTNISITLAGTR